MKNTDDIRTVGLHRFVGADETKLKEQARTMRMAPMVTEVIDMWGFKGTRDHPQLVRWWRVDPYGPPPNYGQSEVDSRHGPEHKLVRHPRRVDLHYA